MRDIFKAIRNPRLLIVLSMGFSSGLPFLLVKGTLKAWLTDQGLDLKTIGFFSILSIPYTWKFIWSPLMDRYIPFRIGRRKSWLLLTQAGVIITLLWLSNLDAKQSLGLVAVAAFLCSFFSSSQDIVVDAYRREIRPDEEIGLGSSLYVLGYRIAMLLAGGGALFFADQMPWSKVYAIMAAVMGVCLVLSLLIPEPIVDAPPPRTMKEAVFEPLKEFLVRNRSWSILIFIVLYKMGESMASDMYNPFFLKLGFTKTDMALVAKFFGFWATIAGGVIGGVLMLRLKLFRSLWYFGILQAIGLLLFAVLALVGPRIAVLALAVGTENFTSGMATSAAVAFMASQSSKRFTATQFALLSSLASLPGTVLGSLSGLIAEALGWQYYYVFCTVITIPGLVFLLRLRPTLEATDQKAPIAI
jgi:PAT family beta-lactamase induction signal transducer AmpG